MHLSLLFQLQSWCSCVQRHFTQKHNKQKTHNPPKELPNMVFILENKIQAWEEFVASKRNIATRIKQCTSDIEEKDGFEGPLKVPNSVLNTCKKSFTAADRNWENASAQYFNSIWCWSGVTMTMFSGWWIWLSPESNSTTLLHLLTWFSWNCMQYNLQYWYFMHVGAMCGHVSWACQCDYHLRKCIGFGLSDCKGCGQFWHWISKLVAFLQVCSTSSNHSIQFLVSNLVLIQHHVWLLHVWLLYTLDCQVHHGDQASLERLGKGILQKWTQAMTKWVEAAEIVMQVPTQTELLPCMLFRFWYDGWETPNTHSSFQGGQRMLEKMVLRKLFAYKKQ